MLRPFLALQTQIAQRRNRLVDVTVLRAQRDSLAALVAAQASLSEENRQLRAALGLTSRVQDIFIPSNVLEPGLTSAQSTFLLDVGSEDGVRVGSPVITAEGLLGVVWEVEAKRSQAIDWTHRDFRISAMTADGQAYGMVQAQPGDEADGDILLTLGGAPFQVDVRPGQRVVSSGRGGQYPRGIPIGTIIGIEDADTGWRKSYLIQPSVRPEAARHVLVGIGDGAPDLSDVWHVSAPPDPLRADTPVARRSGGSP